MSGIFSPSFVIADDNSAISLTHVESINLSRVDEDKIADVLAGDVKMDFRTTSGAVYSISMLKQLDVFDLSYGVPRDTTALRDAIFRKWDSLNR